MGKKKHTYIACVTKYGIAEAIYKDWFDKYPDKQDCWERNMKMHHKGEDVDFKEMTSEKEVEKGVEKYGKYLEKRKKEKQKEIKRIKAKKIVVEKEPDDPKEEKQPKKRGRKKNKK